MFSYIVRRLMYTPLIVVGVLLVTFLLFRVVKGDDSADIAGKNASAETIAEIRKEHGYDKPLLFNTEAAREHGALAVFDSQFFHHFKNSLTLDFGRSKSKQKISTLLLDGAVPSLSLTVPIFFGLLVTSVSLSMLVALRRGGPFDTSVVVICVSGMSLPILATIMFGQYFLGHKLGWFPVFGYEPGWAGAEYFVLPALLGMLAGLGGDVRFYRTVMLDEINSDYIRTAKAKGQSTSRILYKHLLKNAMIPIITRVVLAIPFLFLGSLLLERFFGIPGLGYLMIEAIASRDSQVIMALTFIISILFVLGNLATDVCYALVDPRVSLN
jgi:peptide/nickel transport system permease protein